MGYEIQKMYMILWTSYVNGPLIAKEDEERYGRLVQLAWGMASLDMAGLAAPVVQRFCRVCLESGSEILLTRTTPLFEELASPEHYTVCFNLQMGFGIVIYWPRLEPHIRTNYVSSASWGDDHSRA